MWGSRPKGIKARKIWHKRAMLVDPKKTKISIIYTSVPRTAENVEKIEPADSRLGIADSSLETQNAVGLAENSSVPSIYRDYFSQSTELTSNVGTVDSDVEVVESELESVEPMVKSVELEVVEAVDTDVSVEDVVEEPILEDVDLETGVSGSNVLETPAADSSLETQNAVGLAEFTSVPSIYRDYFSQSTELTSNVGTVDSDVEVVESELESVEPMVKSVELEVVEAVDTDVSVEDVVEEPILEDVDLETDASDVSGLVESGGIEEPKSGTVKEGLKIWPALADSELNVAEETDAYDATNFSFSVMSVDLEPLNVKFLRALEKTRKLWVNDKQFAKIVKKMEKGKNLKRKEFDKVHTHLQNYFYRQQRSCY